MTSIQTVNQETPNADSQFFIVRTAQEVADTCMTVLKDYNEKYVRKTVESGKDFKEGMEKDLRLLADRFIEKGKSLKAESSVIKTVEEKVADSFKMVVDKMSLPSRKEVEQLNDAMKTLGARVDSLSGKSSV